MKLHNNMRGIFRVEKMTMKGIFSNCWLHWHVRDRLPTWENVGKNPVPSCAGSFSGHDRRRAGQDCYTGCWPAWWISSPRPDWPKTNIVKWTINPNKEIPPKKGWLLVYLLLFGWLIDSQKILVNLLSFSVHIFGFAVLVVLDGLPKFQIFVAEFQL